MASAKDSLQSPSIEVLETLKRTELSEVAEELVVKSKHKHEIRNMQLELEAQKYDREVQRELEAYKLGAKKHEQELYHERELKAFQ